MATTAMTKKESTNFEKSIKKAIKNKEEPMKEKHVRNIIIGTFHEKGASYFWSDSLYLPVKSHPVVAWKFCHLLHKVLREGHPNVIIESQKNSSKIAKFGKIWSNVKEGYGILISEYCNLLLTMLKFHKQNPKFPGNLMVTPEVHKDIEENDIHNYFPITFDMYEYLGDIINLQASIFSYVANLGSHSHPIAGQCNLLLAPLIPCIQDSLQLYNFCVKMLYQLHEILPLRVIVENMRKECFLKIYNGLKQFYINASNQKYFQNLIRIPKLLCENPLMFLTHPVPEPTLIPVVAPIPVAVTETVDKVKPVLATTTTVGEQELLPEPENILYSNNTDDHEEYQEVFKNSVF